MSKPQKPIKVMHLTYDMRIGGTEMVIKNIIEGSDSTAFNMSIYCIEEPIGPWGQDMQKNGTSITSTQRKDGFDLTLIKRIRQHVKKSDIDILHCHQYTPWVYGVLAAAGLKTKVIFTEHGRFYPDSSSWKRRIVNPILASMTSGITAISKATKQALVEFEFIPAKRIEVIYNGIKPLQATGNTQALRESYNIAPTTTLLGTIARFDPIKNHPMMLRGLRHCLDKGMDVKLMIVGDGEMRPQIERLTNELKLNDHVILTGYKPEPAKYLEAFDLYLLTSFSEGTSMTLLEAISLGKPCIVTDVGGNPEVIVDGECGLVVGSDDDNELSIKIIALLKNKEQMHEMSKCAAQNYHNRFAATLMGKSYADSYHIYRS